MTRSGGAEPVDPPALRLLDRLTQGLNVVGTGLIFALMLLIASDVLGRNLFGQPISGVPEMVSLSIVVIVFLQAPQALKAGRMTRSDAVSNILAKRAPSFSKAIETVYDLMAIGVIGAIVWSTWPLFLRAWQRGDFVGAVGDFTAPTWPVKAMILLGSAVLVLQFAARILRRFLRAAA